MFAATCYVHAHRSVSAPLACTFMAACNANAVVKWVAMQGQWQWVASGKRTVLQAVAQCVRTTQPAPAFPRWPMRIASAHGCEAPLLIRNRSRFSSLFHVLLFWQTMTALPMHAVAATSGANTNIEWDVFCDFYGNLLIF
jgi:hypothetical protein